MTATLAKWYEERGRHEIFAGNKHVPIGEVRHSMSLKKDLVTLEEQHDLERIGVARNSREEKARARDAQMARLYRKHILKEPEVDLVQIGQPKPAEERDAVGSFGD
jgi:hypothetical protein